MPMVPVHGGRNAARLLRRENRNLLSGVPVAILAIGLVDALSHYFGEGLGTPVHPSGGQRAHDMCQDRHAYKRPLPAPHTTLFPVAMRLSTW